ncbi:hypothetical protein BLNAU_14935 [Blattamonas nauphoetae]|uniref:Uncharacterized protein n=1 Tax=Blattamonas nauphoetae TaxID=2049346 RepID=A0ABQ9XFP6_9EUKA|nr:hypothetical protein BLNAU_14935 [Blattamonas nauphoetae]
MTEVHKKIDTSSSQARTHLSSPQQPLSIDSSPFLNWNEKGLKSESEKAVVFQSLVATAKLQPELDISLKAKAVKFLKSVDPNDEDSADAFLNNFGRTPDESSTNFIQSVVVLISSHNQAITTAAMEMFHSLFASCSAKVGLTLVKADLIPQLIITLNPQSLSLIEAEDIHINITKIIRHSLWLSTPDGFTQLGIEDDTEQQAVHETVLTQVVTPSEMYIWHLCVNRYSIINGEQSEEFMDLLARLLRICPSYQPTMDFVMNMPVFLTIPSCLTFFEAERSTWYFLCDTVNAQRGWNKTGGNMRRLGKKLHQLLRMEGFEDVTETKLRNDKDRIFGINIVFRSIQWNNMQGMNLSKQE